jgi:hypothetical protein
MSPNWITKKLISTAAKKKKMKIEKNKMSLKKI